MYSQMAQHTKNNDEFRSSFKHLQAGNTKINEDLAQFRADLSIFQEEFRKLKRDTEQKTAILQQKITLFEARQYVTLDEFNARTKRQLREIPSLVESMVREAVKRIRAEKSVNADDTLNKLGPAASSLPEHPIQLIRNPPTYNGNDLSRFRPWWSRVTAFMHSYAERFPSDKFKIGWVGSLLSDSAQMWHHCRKKQMDQLGTTDSWDSYSAALQARFKDTKEASRNYKRMRELQYQGDTAKYLDEFLYLNESVRWSGISLQTHIKQTLPHEITYLVYARRGKMPKTDEDFLDAISEAGRIHESMLSSLDLAGNRSSETGEKRRRLRRRRARRRNPRKANE